MLAGKLKMPFDKLKTAILEGDGELLDSVISKQLADFAPTHEEVQKFLVLSNISV